MWVEFVVGSCPCSERFFSGYSGFPLFSKTNISKFQVDLDTLEEEPPCGCASANSHSFNFFYYFPFIYLFIYLFFNMKNTCLGSLKGICDIVEVHTAMSLDD